MRPSWGLVIVVDSAVLSPSFVLVYTPGLRAYSHLLYSYYVEFLCAAWYQSCLRLVADTCNARNHFPGVYTSAGHQIDLYGSSIEVDYRGYEVTVENFIRLLTGMSSLCMLLHGNNSIFGCL